MTVTVPCWRPVGRVRAEQPITASGWALVATSQSPGVAAEHRVAHRAADGDRLVAGARRAAGTPRAPTAGTVASMRASPARVRRSTSATRPTRSDAAPRSRPKISSARWRSLAASAPAADALAETGEGAVARASSSSFFIAGEDLDRAAEVLLGLPVAVRRARPRASDLAQHAVRAADVDARCRPPR